MPGKFWTDAFNGGFGCIPRHTGCARCWAESTCARMAASGNPTTEALVAGAIEGRRWTKRLVVHRDRLRGKWPMQGRRKAEVVAVNWLSDVGLWKADDFCALMDGACNLQMVRAELRLPEHKLLLLTKHPAGLAVLIYEWMARHNFNTVPLVLADSLWCGVTVCGIERCGDEPWRSLLHMPTELNLWACCEPLLGDPTPPDMFGDVLDRRLGWVVLGAETGAGARPWSWPGAMHMERWCHDHRVPLLVKNSGDPKFQHCIEEVGPYVATPWGPLTSKDWPRL